MENEETTYPSWKWVAIMLISIMIGITGYLYAGMASTITGLSKTKLDKEVYYREIDSLEDRMDRLNAKSDTIIKLLMEHERETGINGNGGKRESH